MPNAPPKVHVSARSDAHRSPDSPRAFQCPSHQGVRTSLTPAGERPSSSKATVLPPPHAARVRSARGASEADTARASGSQPPRPSTTTAGATRPPRVTSARSLPSVLSNVRKAADAPNPNPPATDGGPSSKVGGAAVARRRGNKYVPHSRFTRARMRIQVEWLDLITPDQDTHRTTLCKWSFYVSLNPMLLPRPPRQVEGVPAELQVRHRQAGVR